MGLGTATMTATKIRLGCAVLLIAGISGTARADDLIGFYAGGGIGQSNVKDHTIGFNEHDFAWQLTAGLRPIRVVGVELDYMDLGKPASNIGTLHVDAQVRAAAAFAMFYLPLPEPLFDVFGKAGVARVQNSVSTSGQCVSFNSCGLLDFNSTGSQFAWGVGGQVNWGNWSVRLEYEGFNATGGSQALINVGALYKFF
jgi:Outer membrane protein beta-barrel domain